MTRTIQIAIERIGLMRWAYRIVRVTAYDTHDFERPPVALPNIVREHHGAFTLDHDWLGGGGPFWTRRTAERQATKHAARYTEGKP